LRHQAEAAARALLEKEQEEEAHPPQEEGEKEQEEGGHRPTAHHHPELSGDLDRSDHPDLSDAHPPSLPPSLLLSLAPAATHAAPPSAPVPIPMSVQQHQQQQQQQHDDDDDADCSPDSVVHEWEAAAAAHSARRELRNPGAALRHQMRDERKVNKRKVKAEQRERREKAASAALPASLSLSSPRAAAPAGSSHKPKRPSTRDHRRAAQPAGGGWEATLRRLEDEFGEDLAGLSGLVLAR